jgi:hypothetical protein
MEEMASIHKQQPQIYAISSDEFFGMVQAYGKRTSDLEAGNLNDRDNHGDISGS